MARATSSFPVPVCPRINTVASVGGHLLYFFQYIFHFDTLTDDFIKVVCQFDFLLKVKIFLLQLAF